MASVTLSQLEKIYPAQGKNPAFNAVKGIDLQIKDREFMVLVGPSGCGKSTTLRMIAGLEEVTSGSIQIGDTLVNDTLPKDRDIAMVFQNYALYPHMSVYDNMAFGLKLRKRSKTEIAQRVNDAAALLEIEELLDRKPKALSGGQRQRVAVGRAIVRNPKVFLFDEPLSNLDAKMRVSMRAEITKLHERIDATMIYVTHDQVEAMTMGDRICVMNAGEIMQVAEPMDLYNHPENTFVASFIGSPPMNLVEGTLEQSNNDAIVFTETGDTPTPLRIPLDAALAAKSATYLNKQVTFGVRPEDILVQDEQATLEATLDLAETMGAETHLHLNTGAHRLIARAPSNTRYTTGDQQRFTLDLSKAHLFDSKTGNKLPRS